MIRDLVDAGLLPPDAVIEALVQKVPHSARVRNGMIEWEGRQFATPSAASMAIHHAESWNGWVDWRYKGELLTDLAGPSWADRTQHDPAVLLSRFEIVDTRESRDDRSWKGDLILRGFLSDWHGASTRCRHCAPFRGGKNQGNTDSLPK